MSTHCAQLVCRECNKVMVTCRCMSEKKVSYGICSSCSGHGRLVGRMDDGAVSNTPNTCGAVESSGVDTPVLPVANDNLTINGKTYSGPLPVEAGLRFEQQVRRMEIYKTALEAIEQILELRLSEEDRVDHIMKLIDLAHKRVAYLEGKT